MEKIGAGQVCEWQSTSLMEIIRRKKEHVVGIEVSF